MPVSRSSKQVHLRKEHHATIAHDGPYLLDVICPYQEMIPSGGTVRDIILE